MLRQTCVFRQLILAFFIGLIVTLIGSGMPSTPSHCLRQSITTDAAGNETRSAVRVNCRRGDRPGTVYVQRTGFTTA
jgi:hypothetical protein